MNVPHTRGDEPYARCGREAERLMFPTHVGMNRAARAFCELLNHVPHTRGDEPFERDFCIPKGKMFPTHVGMNRKR